MSEAGLRPLGPTLTAELKARGLSIMDLSRRPGAPDHNTLRLWISGRYRPRSPRSLAFLQVLAADWDWRPGYLETLLERPNLLAAFEPGLSSEESALVDGPVDLASLPSELLSWHLPSDFAARPESERRAILLWLRTTFVPTTPGPRYSPSKCYGFDLQHRVDRTDGLDGDALSGLAGGAISDKATWLRRTPPKMEEEWGRLVRFKTETLTPIGMARSTIWRPSTARHRGGFFGRLFGALHDNQKEGSAKGAGADPNDLSLGLLVFPEIWDWYLNTRAENRGFYTFSDVVLLNLATMLTDDPTGWLTQSAWLAENITTVDGLVTNQMVLNAREDWLGACARCKTYAQSRRSDLYRLVRLQRDPFAPILPVLASKSPILEYARIPAEILKHLPSRDAEPERWAQELGVSIVMTLALQTGFRSHTLRNLLIAPIGAAGRTEAELFELGCGELHWDKKRQAWMLVVPATGFKNSHSSHFKHGGYRRELVDTANFNQNLRLYVQTARPILIGATGRPSETLFVQHRLRGSSKFSTGTFHRGWRNAVAKYGVFNPWTARGAIAGLKPHGPHAVRAVIATHILKRTGSLELAGYGLQTSARVVEKHYGRLTPSDKAGIVNEMLAETWIRPDDDP